MSYHSTSNLFQCKRETSAKNNTHKEPTSRKALFISHNETISAKQPFLFTQEIFSRVRQKIPHQSHQKPYKQNKTFIKQYINKNSLDNFRFFW